MMPVLKSGQIISRARQVRALGIGNKKPKIETEPASQGPQQHEEKIRPVETQRKIAAGGGDGNNDKGISQADQQVCEDLLSVNSVIEDIHAPAPSTHYEAAVSATSGAPMERIADKLPVTDPGAGDEDSRQQGWNVGYEQGIEEGLRLGREEALALQSSNERLAAVAEAINLMNQSWQAELESAAIEIGYAALLRIVGQKAGDRAMVESMVRAVLEQLPERRLLNIHLAPADHALFHDGEKVSPNLGAVLLADERVSMGGCIVETDAGSLDGRLETRLAELKALLVEMHLAREVPQ